MCADSFTTDWPAIPDATDRAPLQKNLCQSVLNLRNLRQKTSVNAAAATSVDLIQRRANEKRPPKWPRFDVV